MKFDLKAVLALLATANAAVIEATDNNLAELLGSGVPTILDIYAEWCGHCKTFAPIFDQLAAKYEHATDKVQFIKIDGDKNRGAAEKFQIQYFPTIKWVVGSDHEPVETRDIEALQKLIEAKTGVKLADGKGAENKPAENKPAEKRAAEAPSAALPVQLDDENFSELTQGKNALVAFTTTWCGHCKRMKQAWEEVAGVYAGDDDLVIGTIDCTDSAGEKLSKEFEVRGFPTIFLVTKDGRRVPYQSGRSKEHFVEFLQQQGISSRDVNGQLGDDAGLLSELTGDVTDFVADVEGKLESFMARLLDVDTEKGLVYGHYALKIKDKGLDWAKSELDRIGKIIGSSAPVTQLKKDELRIRQNVLKQFIPQAEEKAGEKADL